MALTHQTNLAKHARRNEGAISFVLNNVQRNILDAVSKQGFHGTLRFSVEVIDQDVMILEDSTGQRFKLK
jgi:hypothetical protein